jgi:signal transduction histidine kinase
VSARRALRLRARWRRHADTLALRLFLWMWLALVLSHVCALVITHAIWGSPHARPAAPPPHAATGAAPDARRAVPPVPPAPAVPPAQPGPPAAPAPHAAPRPGPPDAGLLSHIPALPSLPPTPAIESLALRLSGRSADAATAAPPAMPWPHLLADYLIRALLLAGFAWGGARWLTRPARALAAGARRLAARPDADPAPRLDSRQGARELRHAAAAFNAMARQLSRQLRARALTMAAISHDLRTPLTRLRLRLESPRERPDTDACIADLQAMDALIGQVLELLRDAPLDEPARRLDLGDLLQAVLDDQTEHGGLSSLQAPPAAEILAPPLSLRRLLDNLVGNALRHGGRADVTLTAAADRWCVTIDDDGPGIAPDDVARLLRPWQQLGDGAARGGSGLGLAIADQLARRLGARLQLLPHPPRGLRVQLDLPRGPAADAPTGHAAPHNVHGCTRAAPP